MEPAGSEKIDMLASAAKGYSATLKYIASPSEAIDNYIEDALEEFDSLPDVPWFKGDLASSTTSSKRTEAGVHRSFKDAYLAVVRKHLCDDQDSFRKSIETAMTAGAGALVTVLLTLFGLTGGAAILVIPIAAALMRFGIEAFCDPTITGEASGTPS